MWAHTKDLAQAEVAKAHVARRGEEDVLRFHVAVEQMDLRVQVRERAAKLQRILFYLRRRGEGGG